MSNKPTVNVQDIEIGAWGHQGDVILTRIAALPANIVKAANNILAYGEVTGHHHRFAANAPVCVYKTPSGEMIADVQERCVLEHEEHANLSVPAGIYKVEIQREYDLVAGVRKVMD